MVIEVNLPEVKRYILQHKAMKTAAKIYGLIIKELNGSIKSRIRHWSNRITSYLNYLRDWGEAGVVKIGTNTTTKLAEGGMTRMLLGYADNHTWDCYEMLNC
jgi:hypothetical protein